MIINDKRELIKNGIKAMSAAVGVFDGVHAGHRHLIDRLLALSSENHSVPVAVTFSPHPRAVLFPNNTPPMLMSLDRRVEFLEKSGVKAVIVLPFTREMAAMTPSDFMEKFLTSDAPLLKGLCVGSKWRFGAEGSGDTSFLTDYCEKRQIDFLSVKEFEKDGTTVSSSAIRNALSDGDIRKVTDFLSRPYSLVGTVVHGDGKAGPVLGHPTANVEVSDGVLPQNGVYLVTVNFDGKTFDGVASIGLAPTMRSGLNPQIRAEVHVLGFDGDIYGKRLEFSLLARIRGEEKFSSIDELKTQIEKDVKSAEIIISGKKRKD